jgi:periplasmic protein CpxP/Spy
MSTYLVRSPCPLAALTALLDSQRWRSRFSDSALSLKEKKCERSDTFAELTFALALAFSLTTAAQTSSTEPKQKASPDQSQTDSAGNRHRDRVGERLEWLSQHLNLTEDQKKQLKPILAGEFKQMRAVGEDASLTQDQKREKMKQIHEASRPQVQAILTSEQQQKFAQMKEEAKERRGEKKENGQSDYQPPQ